MHMPEDIYIYMIVSRHRISSLNRIDFLFLTLLSSENREGYSVFNFSEEKIVIENRGDALFCFFFIFYRDLCILANKCPSEILQNLFN